MLTSVLQKNISLPIMPLQLQRAIHALQQGRPVILMDDPGRENEADLIFAAEKLSESAMALLIRECSGIVCLCITSETADRLELPPMVTNNQSRYGTAFTISIEAKEGVTTGVSAADRCRTIAAATALDACPEDLVRPGHVFPLRAHPKGVLGRAGHTEGAVDLCKLAGLLPAAVLCELCIRMEPCYVVTQFMFFLIHIRLSTQIIYNRMACFKI